VPHLTWALAEQLFGGALALAIIGMLESVAIAKSIAAHTGEEISANQEFFAQGLKNFLSSFWHCIPGSGSFTRSALDHAAGAETRFAAVFNAMFVAATFFLFGRWAHYIPGAALAGVLFVIAYRLIDWRHFARLVRTSRSDSVVCLVTFAATLLAPLEYAIFIGIFLNIGLYLRQAARLHLLELARMPDGRFVERPWSDPTTTAPSEVTVLQIEGNLFFGLADELDDRLARLSHNTGVHVVVIRLKRVHAIDATVLHVLERFVTRMHDRQAHVIICGVRPHLQSTLHAYGVVDLIGPTNVFPAGPGVFESAARAIARAVALSQVRHAGQPCGDQPTETESPLLYDI
jgi:SulP family sulfate permease